MADFAALADGIYCIDADYVKPQVAAIYLLAAGGEAALIDTGTTHSLANVDASLAALGIAPAQVRYVIPTHVHLDHAGGAGAMMRRFDQATLLIHPRGARHMIDPRRLVAGTIAVYGEAAFRRLYGDIEPVDASRVDIVEDGHVRRVGDRDLLFVDTPGHARHHFCVYDAASGGIFTGDTFGLSYPPMKRLARGLIPTTPPTQFEPRALAESIDRLLALDPRRIFLTHFGAYENPRAQAASFRRWIDQYVALCERLEPRDDAAASAFEAALGEMILADLDAAAEPLDTVLEMDIRLNAQGLAHWWRGQHDG